MRDNANNDPILLTQLAQKYFKESPGYMPQRWMWSKDTLEFLHQWEIVENPNFDDTLSKNQIRQVRTSFLTLTPSLWVKRPNAIGMTVKQGKGSSVTKHSEIAMVFHLWLDPTKRVTIVRLAGRKQG